MLASYPASILNQISPHQGIPFDSYFKLAALEAAREAIRRKRTDVIEADIDVAIAESSKQIDQALISAYHNATISQRPNESLYSSVLLASTLAEQDELGRFQAAAVAAPLNRIVKDKVYGANTYSFHLNAFCEPERGAILERLGQQRNYRYRFRYPMMQPYVILKGLADGKMSKQVADAFAPRRQLRLSSDF